ncbi:MULTISPECIES: spore coat protein [unclassified Paenibacillus]|uniref:spore coat protein n=1 Tax=unclassified Paenibacillus TaxID=185978 RepID=UPI001046EA3A|nr:MULTISPECIES: spore coat protein [unclassified Paenibacillus]NIK66828.1 spore coat protein CotF [Paenibacillus sp. BK720]TCN00808.1 coat F domain-containing protein [Paenibacillus sp. BK033]
MYQQHHLPDEDLAYTVLSDLKRVVREYSTAATESSCPEVRQMFTQLMNSTLKLQGNLFQTMQSANMYNTASPALRQEIDKQVKEYQQTQQKTTQYLQQRLGGAQPSFQQFGQFQQQQHQPHQPYFM